MSESKKSLGAVRLTRALTKEGVKFVFKTLFVKVGGPNAAQYAGLVDTTVGAVFDQVWDDIIQRNLSTRERLRTATVYEAAVVQIYSRLDGGKTPRDDGFFTDNFDGRTKAEELLEGVFLKARDQYEEKKLLYFGRFFGNIGFRQDIPSEQSNFMLQAAGNLSYRQFVLVALVAKDGCFDGEPLRYRVLPRADLSALMREEMQLLDASAFGGYGFLKGTGSWTSELSRLGRDFFDLFGLNEIPAHEIMALRQIIEQCKSLPIPQPGAPHE